MDFDLFELSDDELLSCTQLETQLEPTQQESEKQSTNSAVLSEFECSGEDTRHAQFAAGGFIRNAFISHVGDQCATPSLDEINFPTLGMYNFTPAQLHAPSTIRFLFGEACINMQYLLCGVHNGGGGVVPIDGELSYYQHRRQITIFLHLLLNSVHDREQYGALRAPLTTLRTLMGRITEPATWKLIYFANSSKGNDCKAPAYHLLHGFLEWKLLDLCLLYKHELPYAARTMSGNTGDSQLRDGLFMQQLESIFEDLLVCSLHHYNKKRVTDLLYSSAFPCTCFKECWLLLQLALQRWFTNNETLAFWHVFNSAMVKLKAKSDQYALTPLGYCEYATWMLHSLTYLQGYRSNGLYRGSQFARSVNGESENVALLEACTQQLLQQCQPSEEQLRVYICQLTPTLLQWWRRPNVSVPLLFWEYFHKRLNTVFYVAGATPSQLAVTCTSGHAYLEKYRALLQQEKPDVQLCSYTLFVILLGKCLQRSRVTAEAAHQEQKLLGRIYSKFSLSKLLALNESGLHHLLELFLVLLLCGDGDTLTSQLRDKLLSIELAKLTAPRQLAVIRGHAALLLLCAQQRRDMSEHIVRLLQQLLAIRNDVAVAKVLADTLPDIYDQADDFGRGEPLLIDAWLPHFLASSTPSEQERTLEALHSIFIKLQHGSESYVEASASSVLKALQTHVLPHVRQQYAVSYSTRIPQLAADFCARADPPTFQRLFQYFTETVTANRASLPQFLLLLLHTERHMLVPHAVVLRIWLQSLVLLGANNAQVTQLTQHVVHLDAFGEMTALTADELLGAKEPLVVFVAAVGKQYTACLDYERRCSIADNFNACLRNFEKWLPPPSATSDSAAAASFPGEKLAKYDLLFRFYSFLAIVIYNCAPIVYTKAKTSCFFHIALTRYVLPCSVQAGKPPDLKFAQLIHRTWPVLLQGIGRLNFKSDPYISKTLNDLVQKWTPHFKISTNVRQVARPYITCLQSDNRELSLYVYERLTNLFLTTQRRQADTNACLVVSIFQEVVDVITTPAADSNLENGTAQLEVFIKATSLLMLEHIMMVDELVPSRALLLDLFKRLLCSTAYRASTRLRALLAEHLRIIIKKHLAYYTYFCFDLLMKLASISTPLLVEVMDFLLEEVRIVEQKRGAGEDQRIRNCLHNLQETIAASSRRIGDSKC